jgi:hypothetical protein
MGWNVGVYRAEAGLLRSNPHRLTLLPGYRGLRGLSLKDDCHLVKPLMRAWCGWCRHSLALLDAERAGSLSREKGSQRNRVAV